MPFKVWINPPVRYLANSAFDIASVLYFTI
jgi:hypothetical protein